VVLSFGTALQRTRQSPDYAVRNGLNTLRKCTGIECVTIAGNGAGRHGRLAVTEPSVLLASLVLPTHATTPAYDSNTNNCSGFGTITGRDSHRLKGGGLRHGRSCRNCNAAPARSFAGAVCWRQSLFPGQFRRCRLPKKKADGLSTTGPARFATERETLLRRGVFRQTSILVP